MDRPHFAYLDGLRGLAILGVVLVHVGQAVSGLPHWVAMLTGFGARGVQLFFVVSGYTLALNYRGKTFDAPQFFIRRFFRIAPMFYLAALIYPLLSHYSLLHVVDQNFDALQIGSTLLFLHGWFPSAINRLVPGGWSIGAEAMFYALFPFILSLKTKPRLIAALAVLSYPVAIACRVLIRNSGIDDEVAFYFFVTQLPAFMTGVGLAFLPQPDNTDDLKKRRYSVLFVTVLAILAISPFTRYSGSWLTSDILFGALLFLAGRSGNAFINHPAMVRLGQISFSLYIVHFGFAALLADRVAAWENPIINLGVAYVVVLTAGILASEVTYRWIESPLIDLGRRLSNRKSARHRTDEAAATP